MRWVLAVVMGMALGAGGCRGQKLCGPDRHVMAAYTRPGKSVMCVDATGKTAVWHEFWPSGAIHHECRFLDGKPEGPYAQFNRNGTKRVVGQYRYGKKAGDFQLWNDKGVAIARGRYRDGEHVGGSNVAVAAPCEKVITQPWKR